MHSSTLSREIILNCQKGMAKLILYVESYFFCFPPNEHIVVVQGRDYKCFVVLIFKKEGGNQAFQTIDSLNIELFMRRKNSIYSGKNKLKCFYLTIYLKRKKIHNHTFQMP